MLRYSFGNIDGKAYGLNANEMSVYEAIGKCSRKDDARGWYADLQTLADQLPHRINRTTVSRAVEKLLTMGLIRKDGKALYTCVQNARENVQITQNAVQNTREVVQIAQNPAPLNNPPINNNNEMEKENTRTCVPAHDTANPTIPGFLDLRKEFSRAGGGGMTTHMEMQANEEWNKCTPAKKIKLLEAVKAGAHFKSRLDWLIADFPEPTPTNWSGTAKGGEMLADHSAAIACYDGKFGVYSNEDIALFNLKKAQQ